MHHTWRQSCAPATSLRHGWPRPARPCAASRPVRVLACSPTRWRSSGAWPTAGATKVEMRYNRRLQPTCTTCKAFGLHRRVPFDKSCRTVARCHPSDHARFDLAVFAQDDRHGNGRINVGEGVPHGQHHALHALQHVELGQDDGLHPTVLIRRDKHVGGAAWVCESCRPAGRLVVARACSGKEHVVLRTPDDLHAKGLDDAVSS